MKKSVYFSIAFFFASLFWAFDQPADLPEIDNSIFEQSPIPVKDKVKALQFGQLLFHKACASCHIIDKAGFDHEKISFGGNGLLDRMMSKIDGRLVDKAPLRTPSVIGMSVAENCLSGAQLCSEGLNENVPILNLVEFKNENSWNAKGPFVQAMVGDGVHNGLASVVEWANSNINLVDMNNEAFYGTVKTTDMTAAAAIGLYEMSIQPTRSKAWKHLNGEDVKLRSLEGMQLYQANCSQCHGSDLLGHRALGKMNDPYFMGRFSVTKDSSDIGIGKAVPLYNLQDAPSYFITGESIGLQKAVNLCAEKNAPLKYSDLRKIKLMLKHDAHDDELSRFTNYLDLK